MEEVSQNVASSAWCPNRKWPCRKSMLQCNPPGDHQPSRNKMTQLESHCPVSSSCCLSFSDFLCSREQETRKGAAILVGATDSAIRRMGLPFHGGRGGVSVALGRDTWVPLAVAVMSKGQMQQSWPEKGMVTRCSDSLSDQGLCPATRWVTKASSGGM